MPIIPTRRRPLPKGWGIVSTGKIARTFAADLARSENAHLVAVCSRSMDAANRFAAEHSGAARSGKLRSVRAHDSVEALVADPSVEMVYVANINPAHAHVVREVLRAGKPVLCEKPLAISEEEASELASLARSRSIFLMEGIWTRHLPAVRRAKQLVDIRAIGKLVAIRADLTAKRTFDPTSRLFDPSQGGGALLDLGVYPISLAMFFAGEPDEHQGRWWRNRAGTDSRAEISMRCGDVSVELACGFTDDHRNNLYLQGTAGAIMLDDTLRPTVLNLYRKPLDPLPEARQPTSMLDVPRRWFRRSAPKPRTETHVFEGKGLQFQTERMARCISRGERECAEMPLDHTLATIRVIEAILSKEPEGMV